MGRKLNLLRKKFGKLIVISFSHSDKFNKRHWNCKCFCGKKVTISGSCLKRGTTKSCGCYRKQNTKRMFKSHGMRYTRFYQIWENMYKSYLGHIEKFREDNTTIERIDVNGNYKLENCSWETWKNQHNNTRRSHFLTFKGETMTITQWSKKIDINVGTLIKRINILRWSTKKAILTSVKTYEK